MSSLAFDLSVCNEVVIVDDKVEDALPLLKLFSSLGVSSLYFSSLEEVSDLNQTRAKSPNLIFLDLNLVALGTIDERTALSNCLGITEKIVGESGFPYVVVIWSNNKQDNEFVNSLKSEFKNVDYQRPVTVFALQKSDYIESEGGHDAFNRAQIEESIYKELKDFQTLELLWGWNALSHDAADGLTGYVAPTDEDESRIWDNKDWDERLSLNFAHASFLGQMNLSSFHDAAVFVRNSYIALSRSLPSIVRDKILKKDFAKESSLIENRLIDGKDSSDKYYLAFRNYDDRGSNYVIASSFREHRNQTANGEFQKVKNADIGFFELSKKIKKSNVQMNSVLRMKPLESDLMIAPGVVCELDDKCFSGAFTKEEIIESTENNPKPMDKILWVELTPLCTYCNDDNKNNFYIAIHAFDENLGTNDFKKECFYKIPPLQIDEKPMSLVVDYRYSLTLSKFNEQTPNGDIKKVLGLLSDDLLADIRFHYVRYIGRLGI